MHLSNKIKKLKMGDNRFDTINEYMIYQSNSIPRYITSLLMIASNYFSIISLYHNSIIQVRVLMLEKLSITFESHPSGDKSGKCTQCFALSQFYYRMCVSPYRLRLSLALYITLNHVRLAWRTSQYGNIVNFQL